MPAWAGSCIETQPVFRRAMERMRRDSAEGSWRSRCCEVLWGARTELLGQTAYTQPALFALEYGLAKLWRSWGVRAGDGAGTQRRGVRGGVRGGGVWSGGRLRLIAARGRLMQGLRGPGSDVGGTGRRERVRER